jgi:uncharacterized membrane-anchored protein
MNRLLAVLVFLGAMCGIASAQSGKLTEAEAKRMYGELNWLEPGGKGTLAGKATFVASKQYTYLNPGDTDKFLRLNGNPPQGSSVTIAPVKGEWFGILHFQPEGYIKDDEKIDADALLKQLKDNSVAANAKKKEMGYATLTIEGWAIAPRYDRDARRLEWGTLLKDDNGNPVVNVSTRILGRSGYTSAVLVTNPGTVDKDLADFKAALKNFDYDPGEKYSEFREGDKVAAYGLGALVVGGAAAAAAKKGGFKFLGALILGGLVAAGALLKRLFSRKSSKTV